jgi:hypothetical protein
MSRRTIAPRRSGSPPQHEVKPLQAPKGAPALVPRVARKATPRQTRVADVADAFERWATAHAAGDAATACDEVDRWIELHRLAFMGVDALGPGPDVRPPRDADARRKRLKPEGREPLWVKRATLQIRKQDVGRATAIVQRKGDHGPAAFATIVRALERIAPPMPRELRVELGYGLQLIVDAHSKVHKAWSRAIAGRLSQNSIQRLEFKGESAALVHVLWFALGSQTKAWEEVYRICKSKAARLGLRDREGEKRKASDGGKIGWSVRAVRTCYDDVRKALPLLEVQQHGQPVLLDALWRGRRSEARPDLIDNPDFRELDPDVRRCLDVLVYCQRAAERGENLPKYVEQLAEYLATLVPPCGKLD